MPPMWDAGLNSPQRRRRFLGGALLLGAFVATAAALVARRSRGGGGGAASVCHPNLARLRDSEGREVLLIGAVAFDPSGSSEEFVRRAVQALRPDLVMLEGGWRALVNTMFFTGKWSVDGQPLPGLNDTLNVDGTEMAKAVQQLRGKADPGERELKLVKGSVVPSKLAAWEFSLRQGIGGGAAAVAVMASANGAPLRFLGPADGGFGGFYTVVMILQQAAGELLEEEARRGAPLPESEVEAALRQADSRVREDADKWGEDARAQTKRLTAMISARAPVAVRTYAMERLAAQAADDAGNITAAMGPGDGRGFRRCAVILGAERLSGVEESLKKAGFSFVSSCS